jgi:hypothetical protein
MVTHPHWAPGLRLTEAEPRPSVIETTGNNWGGGLAAAGPLAFSSVAIRAVNRRIWKGGLLPSQELRKLFPPNPLPLRGDNE